MKADPISVGYQVWHLIRVLAKFTIVLYNPRSAHLVGYASIPGSATEIVYNDKVIVCLLNGVGYWCFYFSIYK